MANYKKYAENLVGDWKTDQYEPQRQVALNSYQTNWDTLTNDFNNLKTKLENNMNTARTEYANTLNNIQGDSYSRMDNVLSSLASRGLADSGIANRLAESDVVQKGTATNDALEKLLKVSSEGVSSLASGIDTLAAKQNKLNTNLAGDLGDIGDAEAANAQQYAGLIGSIAESAAGRAASNASAAASRKQQEEEDEIARRIAIADVLEDEELTDAQKLYYLANEYSVDGDAARNAIAGHANNIKKREIEATLPELNKAINKAQKNYQNAKKEYMNYVLSQNTSPVDIKKDEAKRDILSKLKNNNANSSLMRETDKPLINAEVNRNNKNAEYKNKMAYNKLTKAIQNYSQAEEAIAKLGVNDLFDILYGGN